MSTNKFAQQIGLKRSENLYQIKKGNNSISCKLATRIVEHYPQVDFTWLMTGYGEMLGKRDMRSCCDTPIYEGDPREEGFFSRKPNNSITYSNIVGCDIAIKPSMSVQMALMPQGSVLFLRKIDHSFVDYGQLYLVVTKSKSIVGRVRREDGSSVRLEISDDESILPKIVESSQIEIMFLVLGYLVVL